MFPLTPTLSPKGRGGRPCPFLCGSLSPPESHVSPHPNPLPKGERELTVPVFVWGSLSPQGGGMFAPHPNALPKGEWGLTVPIFGWGSSAYCAPDEVAVMEGGGTRGDARHGLGGTGGIYQHKAGGILGFRPYPLAVVVQRQHVAGRYP
ncbi:hypothetical protein QF003_003248 [Leclercia adecarboxylata]